jgi:twinkle protein
MSDESTLVSKGPCSSCGSSDANALYDDGHAYCFSCETHTQGDAPTSAPVSLTSGTELQRLITQWSGRKPVSIPDRALTSASVKAFGVTVDGQLQAYPYFEEGQTEPVAFKVRGPGKSFRVVGTIKDAGLFGAQRYGTGDSQKIIVTEGELDALAAYQMFDGRHPVVSLRGGAAGAGRDFKSAYQFLDAFAEIILCFDADQAGQDAIAKAADVFAGKIKVMKLDPTVGKDACDYLKAGESKAFQQCFYKASTWTPEGVLTADDLWERLSADRPAALGDWPWDKLNTLTHGFRPTELITVTAGSGLGKSSILRELVMHIKNTTDNKIGCLFMEESVERTAEGFMGVDLSTPVHLPTSSIKRGDEAYKESFERVFRDGQLMVMDASFDTGATVDQVVARVRFMAKALDCKVIILDHISILVSGGQHGDERKALDEIMTKLRTLTQDTGIVLFAVSHLKRPEGKGHEEGAVTSVAQLRGSASIAQLSDFVIGLERNGQADDPIERNTTHIRVLKNRFSGITGPAGHLLYDNETGRLSDYEPADEEEAL